MIGILKFVEPETVFNPETIQLSASAFEDAWTRQQKSGSLTRPEYSRGMREIIAKHIIEMAQQGEKDPQKLAADTISFVAANYRMRTKNKLERYEVDVAPRASEKQFVPVAAQ